MKKNDLTVKRVAIADLHCDPANARKHGQRNLEAIRGSLRQFGQVEPLVVQKSTGKVIGGNGRLEVLKSEGHDSVDIIEVDIDGADATALGVALNRTAELAEWDLPILDDLLCGLKASDISLDEIGFDDASIDKILGKGIDNSNQGAMELEEEGLGTFDCKCPKCGFEFDK